MVSRLSVGVVGSAVAGVGMGVKHCKAKGNVVVYTYVGISRFLIIYQTLLFFLRPKCQAVVGQVF